MNTLEAPHVVVRASWHFTSPSPLPRAAIERLGSLAFTHPGHHGPILRLPKNDALLTVGDRSLRIFCRRTGTPTFVVQLVDRVSASTLDRAKEQLAFAVKGHGLSLWHIGSHDFETTVTRESTVQSLAYSPDRSYLALGYYDGQVEIRTLPSLDVRDSFSMGNQPVDSIVFSPSGKQMAIAANYIVPAAPDVNEAYLRIWHVDDRAPVLDTSFEGDWTKLSYIDERYLTDEVKSFYALDTSTGKQVINDWGAPHREETLEDLRLQAGLAKHSNIERMTISADETLLASEHGVWHQQTKTFQPIRRRFKHVIAVGFTKNETELLSVFSCNEAEAYDIATGRTLVQQQPLNSPRAATVSPDGKFLGLWGFRKDSTLVRLFSLPDWKELEPLRLEGQSVGQVAFPCQVPVVITLSSKGRLASWDLPSGTQLMTVDLPCPAARQLSFSGDGTQAAIALSQEQRVILWSFPDKRELASILLENSSNFWPTALALSPAASLLAIADEDWTIRIFDCQSAALVTELRGHLGTVTALEFSPDGHRLYSASRDGTIIVWNTEVTARDSHRQETIC